MQGVDLRYGAVLYRDIGDEYVTRHVAMDLRIPQHANSKKRCAAKRKDEGIFIIQRFEVANVNGTIRVQGDGVG